MLAIGLPGAGEMILILVVILILFGAGKLPQVMGQMGRGIRSFKDGMKSGEDEYLEEKKTGDKKHTTEREAEEVRK